MSTTSTAAPRIYYGWIVIAVMFTTLFFVLGFRFAFGVFYVAVLDDTGWSRADTAGIFSTAMVVYTAMAILSGVLVDRLGPRLLFPASALVLGIGLILCSTIDSLWEFYLYYGLFIGASYALMGFIPHMAVVPRWFNAKRGLAAAVALAGIGVGALFLSIVSESLIGLLGWRGTFLLFGVVAIGVLIPLNALFHRQSPEALGLYRDGAPAPSLASRPAQAEPFSLRVVLRSGAFWLLFGGVGMIGLCTMTMIVHQTRMTVDYGYSLAAASTLFGLTGLLRSVGGMTWGPLSDRIGRRPVVMIVTVMGMGAVVFMMAASDNPSLLYLSGFVLLFGFAYNGLAPVYATIVSDLFPGRHIGKILGLLDQAFGMGSALGPWVAGAIYDHTGSYRMVLVGLLVAVALTGTCLVAATLRPPQPAGALESAA